MFSEESYCSKLTEKKLSLSLLLLLWWLGGEAVSCLRFEGRSPSPPARASASSRTSSKRLQLILLL